MAESIQSRCDGASCKPNSSGLEKCRSEKRDIDLFIYTADPNEEPILAHRIVLAAASPVFEELFYSPKIQATSGCTMEMRLDVVKRTTMDILVDSIYSGEVSGLNDTNVIDVLVASHGLKLSKVEQACKEYLNEKLVLNDNNIMIIFEVSQKLELSILHERCKKYISENLGPHNCCRILFYGHCAKDEHLVFRASVHLLNNLQEVVSNNSQFIQEYFSDKIMLAVIQTGIESRLCPVLDLIPLVICWWRHDMKRRRDYALALLKGLPLSNTTSIKNRIRTELKLGDNLMQDVENYRFLTDVSLALIGKNVISSSSSSSPEDVEITPIIVSSSSLSPKLCPTKYNIVPNILPSTSSTSSMLHVSTLAASLTTNKFSRCHQAGDVGGFKKDSVQNQCITTCLLSPNSLTNDSMNSDVQAAVRHLMASTVSNHQEEEDTLPTFFFLAGNVVSKRRLRCCDLNEKRCYDVARFSQSKYVDNEILYLEHQIYVIGGQDGTKPTNEVHIYDLNNKLWSRGPSMLEPRCEFKAIFLQDGDEAFIYAVGADQLDDEANQQRRRGRSKNRKLEPIWTGTNTVERLQVRPRLRGGQSYKWQYVDYMNLSRQNHGIAVLNNKLYVAGGNAGNSKVEMHASRSLEYYDPSVRSQDDQGEIIGNWSVKHRMDTPRIGPCLVATREFLYVMGGGTHIYQYEAKGKEKISFLNTTEIYHPVDDCWRPGKRMIKKRQFCDGFLYKGHIYVIGGDVPGEKLTVERLDLSLNRWSMVVDVDDNIFDASEPIWSVALKD